MYQNLIINEMKPLKFLLPLLTLTPILSLFPASTILAVLKPSDYLPQNQACAIYKGGIDSEKSFTFWIENKRQIIVKADSSLNVAVTLKGKIVPPYQVASLPNSQASEFIYRTANTGDHTIFIRGIAPQSDIRICLN